MDEPAAARAVSTDARGSAFGSPGLADPTAWMAPPDLRPAGGAEAQGVLRGPVPRMAASPRLSHELFARLAGYGTPQQTRAGDVLFKPGDEDVDLIVVAEGSVEVIRTETADAAGRDRGQGPRGRFRRRTEPADRAERLPPGPGPGGRDGLPGHPRAAAPADGERRRAVRHRLQGADRPPGAAAAQHRRPGRGDRRPPDVGRGAGAADLRRPAAR